MKILIIFNHEPYDGTDVTWNGLRLADKLVEGGSEVRIFLMNDAVDLARDACRPPEAYEQDLSGMLKALIARGVTVRVEFLEYFWRHPPTRPLKCSTFGRLRPRRMPMALMLQSTMKKGPDTFC